jgi:proteasome assembly chaperone (PAC2) family protein
MPDAVVLSERPTAPEIHLIAGWRQWADGGSISSGLPQYLIQQTSARPIGTIRPDGFYLFQIPGTHDLVRPVVHFDDGFPKSLAAQRNEFFYSGDDQRGIVYFLGDEPHLDIERYTATLLDAAQELKVKRIVTLGGVYGELPYDKERTVSAIYSLPSLKEELDQLSVTLSEYHGGASIGSYMCRRASERNMEMVGFYGMVPTYDFSVMTQDSTTLHIENDFTAWLGIMRRINHMLKTRFDLGELEKKSEQLQALIDAKVDEIARSSPQFDIRAYFRQLDEDFTEATFNPLDDVWADELRRIFKDSDSDDDIS